MLVERGGSRDLIAAEDHYKIALGIARRQNAKALLQRIVASRISLVPTSHTA
jgi:hypothetical protein